MAAERARVKIFPDDKGASLSAAARVAEVVRSRAAEGRPAVLGLVPGRTPVNICAELIRLHREEGLDLSGVVVFALTAYWPLDPAAPQSRRTWLRENLLGGVNVRPENVHLLSPAAAEGDPDAQGRALEAAIAEAGGMDLALFSVGRNGHVGFNPPDGPRDARTRAVRLDVFTRKDAASEFFGAGNVPEMGLTAGPATLLEARELIALVYGEHKAPLLRRIVEGPPAAELAAGLLQGHPRATLYADEPAAAELTRVAAPWLAGPCRWDELLTRHAVIWLARRLGKPILKLTDEDYAANGLAELRARGGGAYAVSRSVFGELMATITPAPCGTDRRRIVVFSPHPDDDVVCMGGTMMKLAAAGHELHVAYMVSGALGVVDGEVARYADFVRQFNGIFDLGADASAAIERHIEAFLTAKRPGDTDSGEVTAVKALIRRTEAMDAARSCGVAPENVHFLDLPFYNTGRAQKLQVGAEDVARVGELLQRVRPEIIFAAGDLSDPHGTHRLCQEAGLAALDEYVAEGRRRPELLLYRGAWEEWSPEQIALAVPLGPEELTRKRFAIFRHQSQKDRVMFPGPFDSRPFWQRAEERNLATAALYDALGLPAYHAVEAFARYPLGRSAHAAAQLETARERI